MRLRRKGKIGLRGLSSEGQNALRKIGNKGPFGVYEEIRDWGKKGSLTFPKRVTDELLDKNLIEGVYVIMGKEPNTKKYLKYVRTKNRGLQAYLSMARK